jgi:hypothetical protein
MKLAKLSAFAVAFAFLCATASFSREPNKATLDLTEKVRVNGTALNPGSYTVDWEGSGPNVAVNIHKGKETVATASATVIEEPTPNGANAYGSVEQPDGSRVLTAIYVGGKRTTLNLTQQ